MYICVCVHMHMCEGPRLTPGSSLNTLSPGTVPLNSIQRSHTRQAVEDGGGGRDIGNEEGKERERKTTQVLNCPRQDIAEFTTPGSSPLLPESAEERGDAQWQDWSLTVGKASLQGSKQGLRVGQTRGCSAFGEDPCCHHSYGWAKASSTNPQVSRVHPRILTALFSGKSETREQEESFSPRLWETLSLLQDRPGFLLPGRVPPTGQWQHTTLPRLLRLG